jgi:hypothetical protein
MKNLLYILLSSLPAVTNAQLWLPLDEGVSCDEQSAFTSAITNMYYDEANDRIDVIGYFRHNNECEENRGFAYWDGQNWNSYPSSCLIPPNSLALFEGEKYAAGKIVCANLSVVEELCQLVGDSWHIVPSNPPIMSTSLLKVINNHFYIGTMFLEDENGEVPLLLEYFPSEDNYVILAKKTAWEVVNFEELLVYNDSLFIGGKFDSNQSGQPDNRMSNLAKISGNTIEKVGQGINANSNTYSMCVHRDTLFVGGIFGSENFPGFTNEPYIFLIYYHNGEIKPYPIQANAYVSTMVSHNDILYLGGWFTQLGADTCYGVGALVNSQAVSLNNIQFINGLGTPIEAFAPAIHKLLVVDDHLYMAGRFEYIGEDGPYGNIAKLSTPLSEFSKVIEDKMNWEMKLYPNPANQYITLEIPLGAKGILQIFNNLGQLVHQENISQVKTNISISNLNSGAYSCVFRTSSNTTSKRIIIQ